MPNTFIIIKGQPKALQIEQFRMGDNGVYDVKFKSSPRTYHYRYSDVVWLKDAVLHDHLHCKVYIGGREQHNVEDIRSFQHGEQTHWRITFSNGYVQDYLHGSIQVVESCLSDDIANNAFEFLKRIAQVNELGKDEEHGGILPALYEKIGFIDKELVAAPYLNPNEYHVKRHRVSDLIFPFGCNSSHDFLIVNHVTKKPVLAIETDGYNFHHEETVQHRRDEMKNHILEMYGLPLLRLSTTGSGEKDKIIRVLKDHILHATSVRIHKNCEDGEQIL